MKWRKLEVRQATEDDLDDIVGVVQVTFPQDFDFGDGFDPGECRDMFSRALEDANELVIVVEVDLEVVGFVYYINKPPTNGTIVLEMIGVRKDLQGHGIGRELIRRGDDLAVAFFRDEWEVKNLATIHLTTSADNVAGQNLYLKSGYEQVGTIPGLVGEGNVELVMLKRVADVKYRQGLWAKPKKEDTK